MSITFEIISNNTGHEERGARQEVVNTLLFKSYAGVQASHNLNTKSTFSPEIRAEKIAAAEAMADEWAQAAHIAAVDLGIDIERVIDNFIEGKQRASLPQLAYLDQGRFIELGFSIEEAEHHAKEGVPVNVAKNFEEIKTMGFSPTELRTMFQQSLRSARARVKERVRMAFMLEEQFKSLVPATQYEESYDWDEEKELAIINGLIRSQDFIRGLYGRGLGEGWGEELLHSLQMQQQELKYLNPLLADRHEELQRHIEEAEQAGYEVQDGGIH